MPQHARPLRVSVIVCTYRRPDSVRRLLLNLCEQALLPSEVLVVDSSPGRDTKRVVESLQGETPYDLRYFVSEKGLTRQRNFGINQACCELACFLDDDVLLDPRYLAEIVHVFDKDHEGSVGGVSGYIIDQTLREPTLRWKIRRWLIPGFRLEPGTYQAGYSIPYHFAPSLDEFHSLEYLPGANMVYRSHILRKLQFSEMLYTYGGEDLEFSMRVGEDYRLLLCSSAKLQHLHEASGRPAGWQRGVMEMHNRYHIFSQRSPLWYEWLQFWWALLVEILVITPLVTAKHLSWYRVTWAVGRLYGLIRVALVER